MLNILEKGKHLEDPRGAFEFASSYILLFELALDTILMPALKKLSNDPVQADVFRRIDKDESRHLAMDYWLLERKGLEQKGLTLEDIMEKRFGKADFLARLRLRAKLAASLGTFLLGFGSMAIHVRELRSLLMDKASLDKYLELVDRVPKKAPHALDVPAYRTGLSGQGRILKMIGLFGGVHETGAA
jgi:hypothetical protein